MNAKTTRQAIQGRILPLLDDLPPESLTLVEHFVRFLREQTRRGQPVTVSGGREGLSSCPTVALPPSSLDGWLNLVPEGYEGDALVDAESLYNEA